MRAVLAVLLAASASAQPVETSVCEILASPESFDGKMVRIRAAVRSGFEVFALEDAGDDRCSGIWLTYAGVELPNDAAFKKFEALLNAHMYPRSRAMSCMECNRYKVTATMTGRLDASGAHQGFGHMNSYKAQFELESVANVTTEDLASYYDGKVFSRDPVKFPTGYLSGRLLTAEGQPIEDAPVEVVSTQKVPRSMHDFTEWTDENGAFEVAVPPGRYRIGANLDEPPSPAIPFPATYYTGDGKAHGAKTIAVADGQHVKGLVIRMSPRLRERKVPIEVLWPDGKPVEEANVWLAEVRRPTWVVGMSVSHTDKDGRFDLIGFEGIDYIVHANIYVKPYYKPHCAEKRTLHAGDALDGRLVMTLTRTGQVCVGDD